MSARTCAREDCAAPLPDGKRARRYCSLACYHAVRSERLNAPDAYDVAWQEFAADRRVERSFAPLADGVRCLRAGDRAGVSVIWHKADLPALYVAALARIASLEDALRESDRRIA